MMAYSINNNNPVTNFYYAELNFKYEDYTQALLFYKIALELGYKNKEKNLTMIAVCYEKLGDLEKALETYKKIETPKAQQKVEQLQEELGEKTSENNKKKKKK